jgi:hypothetical protein
MAAPVLALDLFMMRARVIVLDHFQPEFSKVHKHEALDGANSQGKAGLVVIAILSTIGFSGPGFRQAAGILRGIEYNRPGASHKANPVAGAPAMQPDRNIAGQPHKPGHFPDAKRIDIDPDKRLAAMTVDRIEDQSSLEAGVCLPAAWSFRNSLEVVGRSVLDEARL